MYFDLPAPLPLVYDLDTCETVELATSEPSWVN